MLYEIKNVKQNEGEPRRRRFIDDYFDLVVWSDANDKIEGFQLCYDKTKNQHALTWHKEFGYMHNRVDEGKDKAGKPKSIPVLVTDGFFPCQEIADTFKRESKSLDKKIAAAVYKKILEYPDSDSRKTADSTAVQKAALDYIEGWYDGNIEQMGRSLHPELRHNRINSDPKTQGITLIQMSAMSLIKEAMLQVSKKTLQKEFTLLDISENLADVRIITPEFTDYLQMAKFNGRWLIVNILREIKSEIQ